MLVEKEKVKNNAIRMQIIGHIMDIYDSKSLELLNALSGRFYRREWPDHPMRINEIAELMNTEDIVKILDVLKDSEPGQIAVEQMKEAFKEVLESCPDGCYGKETEKSEVAQQNEKAD